MVAQQTVNLPPVMGLVGSNPTPRKKVFLSRSLTSRRVEFSLVKDDLEYLGWFQWERSRGVAEKLYWGYSSEVERLAVEYFLKRVLE